MKTGIILQQSLSSGECSDQLRFTFMRHSSYARAWNFDYWAIMGDLMTQLPFYRRGGWGKIDLIRRALEQGYKDVVWVDTDAAIYDHTIDLREALKDGGFIGCAKHDAPWFKKFNIPVHFNTGVMYIKNSPQTLKFIEAWAGTYEQAEKDRWLEQGQFNRMIAEPEWAGMFVEVPAKWNSTVKVNMVPDPVVLGWHGDGSQGTRLAHMKETLKDEWVKFRV